MKVLITGATGFIGSYLVEDLVARGHEVAVLLRNGSNTWRLRGLLDRVRSIEGSLEYPAALREPVTRFAPDALVHLAWWGVRNADRNEVAQARNIPMAAELAAVAAELGVRILVGAGSQAEYGPYDRAIREDDPARPTTLYGEAKLAARLMLEQVCKDRGLRFAWVRVFSTYGPRDNDDWLIPTIIRVLLEGGRMPLTAGEQRWGFLHARDAAAALRTILETPFAQGVFNLGSPDAPVLRDTIGQIGGLVADRAELGFGDIAYRPDQVMVLQANVERLSALGWKPMIDLKSGLQETVSWYVRQYSPRA